MESEAIANTHIRSSPTQFYRTSPTTYTFAKGNLQGLGFGLGLFYVGERQGDLTNSFSVPSYLRTDAAVYYQRGHLGIALNLKNLFNVQYFTPRTINLVYPEDPFIVQGTVSWKF